MNLSYPSLESESDPMGEGRLEKSAWRHRTAHVESPAQVKTR
jgi:hypothetical protein